MPLDAKVDELIMVASTTGRLALRKRLFNRVIPLDVFRVSSVTDANLSHNDISEIPPQIATWAELKTLDDDMVLNRAFLVSRANEPQFDARMRSLSESREGRMVFRYVGPVPTYYFVQLRADWQMGAPQA